MLCSNSNHSGLHGLLAHRLLAMTQSDHMSEPRPLCIFVNLEAVVLNV